MNPFACAITWSLCSTQCPLASRPRIWRNSKNARVLRARAGTATARKRSLWKAVEPSQRKLANSSGGPDAAVAYLGDDTSDEEAFGASHGRAFSILVREQYRRSVVDVWIRPPDDVAAFLRTWISVCKAAA